MTPVECAREQDVLDALAARRWPERSEDELRAHVATCATCADLATVAGALLEAGESAEAVHELPPASLVWWRAQVRAREEAARAALLPIRAAQLAGVVCATILLVLAVTASVPPLGTFISAAASRTQAMVAGIDARAAAAVALDSLANRGVQLAAGAWLVLAPVAAYLAFSRD